MKQMNIFSIIHNFLKGIVQKNQTAVELIKDLLLKHKCQKTWVIDRSILPVTPASQYGIEKVVEVLGKISRADGPSMSMSLTHIYYAWVG